MSGRPARGLAALLFDKDGTLVDFDLTWGPAGHAVMHRLAGGDRATVERIAAAMHYGLDDRRFAATSPLVGGAPDAFVALWAEALGRPADKQLFHDLNAAFTEETLRSLAPLGDPEAILRGLKGRGLILGIATNDGEASARLQLAALGLDAHMDFVAGFDSGHGGKPDPGMVRAFARAVGVPPERVGMVGDSPHDLTAARAAGSVAIAVLSGPAGREVLEPLADHVIESVADLPALVDRLAA